MAYSGGKDSTAVLKLLFTALSSCSQLHKSVTVVHCHTGVEIPLLSRIARRALNASAAEAKALHLPLDAAVVRPPIAERFFVKLLGSGYPPPTDKFRWCTDRLTIDPLAAFLKRKRLERATVVVGVRETESATRNLTLEENGSGERFWSRQKGTAGRTLFMPILDFSVDDVWRTNFDLQAPTGLPIRDLANLYASASGPTDARDREGAFLGVARFGCWTCTVAKHGKTLRNLIAAGRRDLAPLLEFRLWIESERNNPENRWRRRRNGDPGPGPMTKKWRRRALDRLLAAQAESGFSLIPPEEMEEIGRIWRDE